MDGNGAASTLAALNELFAHCRRHAPFYRDRLPSGDLGDLAELQQVPVLRAEDLRPHLPPRGREALAGPLEASYAFASGGTSGQPKLVFYTGAELEAEAEAIGQGLAAAGVRPGMVAANLMNAGHLWASFVVVNRALEACRCHVLPIAAQTGEVETLDFIRSLGAELAVGIPSYMISLAQAVEAQGVVGLRIPLLATGGEHFLSAAQDYVRPRLGVERFLSVGYSSNDTGIIGYQCPECAGGVHHVFDALCLVEVLEEGSDRVLPVGETGRIVLTKLRKRLMPVIRYDLGDRGRLLPGTCACGRPGTRLELFGRSDEVLVLGGYNVTPEHVATLLQGHADLSPHFRMIARLDGPLSQLCIEVEAAANGPSGGAPVQGERLAQDLLARLPALRWLVETKQIGPPRVVVLPPGALPRNPRTGKLRRVLDTRFESPGDAP